MTIEVKFEREYYEYLDELRRSGITNMYSAASYLRDAFDFDSIHDARDVLKDWQDSFAARREAGETGD